jgi:hypothetical protein
MSRSPAFRRCWRDFEQQTLQMLLDEIASDRKLKVHDILMAISISFTKTSAYTHIYATPSGLG